MAEIGSLVVDLALKSAEFINNLNKAAGAVQKNQTKIQRSMAAVQRSVASVGEAFAGFLTLRTIRQITNLTSESLRFAATLEGPLGKSAAAFNSQFEELQQHFEVGLASGFLDELSGKFKDTTDQALALQEAGQLTGGVLADIFIAVLKWVSTLPQQIHEVELNLAIVGQTLERWANNTGVTWLVGKFHELAALAPQIKLPDINIPGADLVSPDTSAATDANTTSVTKLGQAHAELIPLLTEENARLLQNAASMESWNTQVFTAGGDVLNLTEQLSNHRDVIEQLGTPMERYALALQKIAEGNYSAADAARLHSAAVAQVSSDYLGLAGSVAGSLATIFKDNKGFAIAAAVINTAQAVTKTIAEYGFTPWGIAAAAAAAAAGAAQIATIASASPGGGAKSVKSPKAAATTATSAGNGGSQFRSSQAVNVIINGSTFTRDQVRQLAEQLNGLVADGATIRTS